MPVSAFYDNVPDPATGNPSIYGELQGQSIIRVEASFSTLVSGRMKYCATCISSVANQLIGVIDTLGSSVPLRLGADGFFARRVLFDSAKVSTLSYRFVIDGHSTQTFVHTLSAEELATGVATLTNVTPLVELSAFAEIQPNQQQFGIFGNFTLGNGGAVNPLTDEVNLQLGSFSSWNS